jgi:predicted dehydrogenase/aryl-alcohol dehydrogenase-like predicted oxidoreductase
MADRLTWGIIGTGNIAGAFARGLAHSKTGKLVAVGSRRRESAEAFGDKFNVPRRHASYEELLADPQVQAVYVAVPHPLHPEWAIKAAEAGKHVLCEKPLALNHPQAMAIVEAAAEHDVFLMEAFMYRCHPQTARLVELIREGAVGEVRVIQATFAFQAGLNPEGRLFNLALGGGGILDVGCYPVSLSRLVAGVAQGKDFVEPLEVKAVGHLGETGVDEWSAAVLRFPGDIVAEVATGVRVGLENVVRIFGSEGHILVPSPWIVSREGGSSKIVVQKRGAEPREVVIETDAYLYGLEADVVARDLSRRQARPPAMTWDDTLGNVKALDAWREAVGLRYPADTPEGWKVTVANRPLRVKPDHVMTYGEIPGVGKRISRLFMGVDNQPTIAHASVMFDHFVEHGGNAFDTAYVYRGGQAEPLLGQWVLARDIREEVVILDKGAHTPNCNPEALTRQLLESLDRLQMDYLDIYLMHRDNPAVPVGEFVDVLNEHKNAGRIRVFGGSNWTAERLQAANDYARKKGLQGFSAVSNNFSLARMLDPVWPGCLSASTPEFRAWLTKTQLPLISWSSQARGFFTDRSGPGKTSDAELVRCWYSEDNFSRKARAEELARARSTGTRGLLPINIALAYVLNQPFPTFAIIGPRVLAETRTSLPALTVKLTPEEVRWLNLED